jgi:hypothetical protein
MGLDSYSVVQRSRFGNVAMVMNSGLSDDSLVAADPDFDLGSSESLVVPATASPAATVTA